MVGRVLDSVLPVLPLQKNESDTFSISTHGGDYSNYIPGLKGIECGRTGFSLATKSYMCCSSYKTQTYEYISFPVQDSIGKVYCFHAKTDHTWSVRDYCSTWSYFTVCGGQITGTVFLSNGTVIDAGGVYTELVSCLSSPVAYGERVNDAIPCETPNPTNPTPNPTFPTPYPTYPTPNPTNPTPNPTFPTPNPTYPNPTYPNPTYPTYPPTRDIVVPDANGLKCHSKDFSLVNDPDICCSRVSHRIISYPVKDSDGNVYCFADGIHWDMQDTCATGFFTVCGGDASGIKFSHVGKPDGGLIHLDRISCFGSIRRDGTLVDPNLPCEIPTVSPTIAPTNDEGGGVPLVYIILGAVCGVIFLCLLRRFCAKSNRNGDPLIFIFFTPRAAT